MKRFLVVTLLLSVTLVVVTSTASATVVNLASWRCGEDDHTPGPTGMMGAADVTAVDGTGNGHNLASVNPGAGPLYAYSSDYIKDGKGPLPQRPAASTVDIAFVPLGEAGDLGYYSLDTVPMGKQNWGMQISVQCNDLTNELVFLQNGYSGTGTTLFSLNGTRVDADPGVRFMAEIQGGTGIFDSGVAVDSAWHNLALVNDGGTTTFYVDGNATNSRYTGDTVEPLGYLGLGRSAGGSYRMAGGLDEARIFTFAPGAFSVSDLGLATPEPGTLILLTTGLVGLAAYAWRKRK